MGILTNHCDVIGLLRCVHRSHDAEMRSRSKEE